MDVLHRASVLNNMGVHMLEMNNTVGAIQVFQVAVHVMKEVTEPTSMPTITTTTPATPITQTSLFPEVVMEEDSTIISLVAAEQPRSAPFTFGGGTSNAIKSTSSSTSIFQRGATGGNTTANANELNRRSRRSNSNSRNHDNEEYYFIFDKAFLLPTTDMFSAAAVLDDVDYDHMTNVSAIILFNFCLSCHLHGVQFGRTTALRQALRMYELTVHMLQQAARTDTVTSNNCMFLRVLMCLILNNMASILYDDLCCYSDAIYCMECVQSLLMRRNDTTENDDGAIDQIALEFIHETVWTNIKLNTLFVQLPSAAQAA